MKQETVTIDAVRLLDEAGNVCCGIEGHACPFLEQVRYYDTIINSCMLDDGQIKSKLPMEGDRIMPSYKCALVTGAKKKSTKTRTVFKKPTVEEVKEYAKSIGFALDASAFIDYYEVRGWKTGGKSPSPIHDWQSCVRNWQRRDEDKKQRTKESTAPKMVY